jgi:hypothetical protein
MNLWANQYQGENIEFDSRIKQTGARCIRPDTDDLPQGISTLTDNEQFGTVPVGVYFTPPLVELAGHCKYGKTFVV